MAKRKHSLSESGDCEQAKASTLHARSQHLGDAALKTRWDRGCRMETALAGALGQLCVPGGVGGKPPQPCPFVHLGSIQCAKYIRCVSGDSALRSPCLAIALLMHYAGQDCAACPQPPPVARRAGEDPTAALVLSTFPRSRLICCQRKGSSPRALQSVAVLLCR